MQYTPSTQPGTRAILGLVVVLMGCYDSQRQSSQSGQDSVQTQSGVHQPPSGNYIGTISGGDTDDGQYLRLGDSSSALYEGLRWIRICELTHEGELSFRTATLFERSFGFRGTRRGEELVGSLTSSTRSWDVVFRRIDDGGAQSGRERDGKGGFYSNLTYVEQAGDNVGAELLVGTIGGQRMVALMMAEGAVGDPMLGFNILEAIDTLRFEVWRDSSAPKVTAVFTDSIVQLSLSNEVGPPHRLRKKFSVHGFYSQPAVGECGS